MKHFFAERSPRARPLRPVCRLAIWLALVSPFVSPNALADRFCFLLAQNYYEQLYCEIVALGRGEDLPSLHDFRNNDELTQALALKQPARRAGIEVKLPNSGAAASTPTAPSAVAPSNQSMGRESPVTSVLGPIATSAQSASQCELTGSTFRCGEHRFAFVANRRNSELAEDVFAAANRMALPGFEGDLSSPVAVDAYLARAYPRYLDRMMALGLGEATMTYGKFAAIFYDVTGKGVDFSSRMETMYRYLKKDKQNLGVTVSRAPPVALADEHCEAVDGELLRCVYRGRNYLFSAAP